MGKKEEKERLRIKNLLDKRTHMKKEASSREEKKKKENPSQKKLNLSYTSYKYKRIK